MVSMIMYIEWLIVIACALGIIVMLYRPKTK